MTAISVHESHNPTMLVEATEEERTKARVAVARRALSMEDYERLVSMLGLDE